MRRSVSTPSGRACGHLRGVRRAAACRREVLPRVRNSGVAPGLPVVRHPGRAGRFCGSCGSPLDAGTPTAAAESGVERPVAERRVTSVLFGDLVGFTPLSESKDSEEVRELLSRTSRSAGW